jgi:hypothetical protein
MELMTVTVGDFVELLLIAAEDDNDKMLEPLETITFRMPEGQDKVSVAFEDAVTELLGTREEWTPASLALCMMDKFDPDDIAIRVNSIN